MRCGVIINPKAGRGNGKGLALAAALLPSPDITLQVLERFDQLFPALRLMLERQCEVIFISSGDGTVQAIQSWLAEESNAPRLPMLCILPHGTTNMTAADIGFRARSIAAQAAFVAAPQLRDLRARPTVRVANPQDGRPRHGMFLGTGAVTEATRYTQTALNDRGVKGSYATFATVAGALAKSLFSKPNPADKGRFDRPFPIIIRHDGGTLCSGMQLMALVTTLDKLILGTRPFWGGKTGPLRVTSFPYPVPNLLRWFVPAVAGGEQRRPPPGACSLAVSSCTIETPVDFVIDGEFFSPPAHEALRVEAGPHFTYVVA